MGKVDISTNIVRLAKMLQLSEQQEILYSDWQRYCIVCRIGMDPRTHRAWMDVAVAEGILRPKKVPGRARVVIWNVDKDCIQRLLDNGTEGGVD